MLVETKLVICGSFLMRMIFDHLYHDVFFLSLLQVDEPMDAKAPEVCCPGKNAAPKPAFTVSIDQDQDMDLLQKLFTSNECFDIPTL
jgi:hypothetical protein